MSESALKLTTYFGERARVGKRLIADELLDVHARHAIRLSVLLRGIQGFGAKHRLRTDRLLTLSEDLPLVSVAIDTRERIETLRQDLAALGGEGLVTVESARAADSRDRGPASRRGDGGGAPGFDPASLSAPLPAGSGIKLTVCLGRHEHVAGEPAFVAACRVLREAGASGATVLLGVDGTIHGERRRARFFARNLGVPLLVVSVGSLEQVDRALASLAETLPSFLFVIERVCLCKRDGELLWPPGQDGAAGLRGSERQKLTIVISEAARHHGHPVYLELVRRLRAQRAAGATSLRGIWGFHGEHAPHGDRLLSLRRHVPVITEVIDTPERIAALFGIVDELTSERGLVTSESVPASAPPRIPPAL